jgi:hypothetical protein
MLRAIGMHRDHVAPSFAAISIVRFTVSRVS